MNGIKHFHSFKPPIAHRDIKVENILINNNKFKICDFGSATTDEIDLGYIYKWKNSLFIGRFQNWKCLNRRRYSKGTPLWCTDHLRCPISTSGMRWMKKSTFGCLGVFYIQCVSTSTHFKTLLSSPSFKRHLKSLNNRECNFYY